MTIPNNERFWSPEELAQEFGLKLVTVRSWIRSGQLQTIRIGDRHRVYESYWQQFLDKCNK